MKRTLAAGIVLATLSSATALASADAATSNPATQHAKAGSYRVTASVNKTEPLLNSKVKIKGSVSPAAPGARVVLQARYEDRNEWKTIDSARLNNSSRYKFKDKVGSVRERKYRVVKAASARRSAGHSPAVKVTVYGWRDLTSIPPATSSNMSKVDSVKINGVTYPHSVRSWPTYQPMNNSGSIDYNLNRACTAFRGTAGIDDSSPAAGNAMVQLSTDGTQRYASGYFGLTQSAPVAFDVTNVFRLTIATAVLADGVAVVGTPQVLCSF
jgi:NPCBM/NEW2 domain-containing protein